MQKRSKIVDLVTFWRAKLFSGASNDLVKSFGNLKAFEHKEFLVVSHTCRKESKKQQTFQTTISDI